MRVVVRMPKEAMGVRVTSSMAVTVVVGSIALIES